MSRSKYVLSTDPSNHRDGLAAWRDRFDDRLESWLPAAEDDSIGAAMRAALLGPGKRLRPLLMFTIAIDTGIDEDDLIDAACAIEMVHAASLVLDDLPCMDDASVRRGRPCVHIIHGEATAVLASVALLGQAFLAAASSTLPWEARGRCMSILAEVIGPDGLVRGQSRDLDRRRVVESDEAARQTDVLKTGSLFHAAIRMVATIGNLDAHTSEALATFAAEFGCAFQMADDIADAGGSDAGIGSKGVEPCCASWVERIGCANAARRLQDRQRRAKEAAVAALGTDSALGLLIEHLYSDSHGQGRIHLPDRSRAPVGPIESIS